MILLLSYLFFITRCDLTITFKYGSIVCSRFVIRTIMILIRQKIDTNFEKDSFFSAIQGRENSMTNFVEKDVINMFTNEKLVMNQSRFIEINIFFEKFEMISVTIFIAIFITVFVAIFVSVSTTFFAKGKAFVRDMLTNKQILKKRFNVIFAKKKFLEFNRKLIEIEIDEAASFFQHILFIEAAKIKKTLLMKKLFNESKFEVYDEINQHALNVFVKKIIEQFDTKSTIYASNRFKILFVQKLFEKISINQGHVFKNTSKAARFIGINFVIYFQEFLNLIHFRVMKMNHKMKMCKQFFDQKIADLITYFVDLKNQFFISFIEFQQYMHLLKVLHSYFRVTIMRRIIGVMIKIEFEKFARMIEKIEYVSKYFRKKVGREKKKGSARQILRENVSNKESQKTFIDNNNRDGGNDRENRENRENDDEYRDGLQKGSRDGGDDYRGDNRGKGRGERGEFAFYSNRKAMNMSKIECYNCHKFDHYKTNCSELKKKSKKD